MEPCYIAPVPRGRPTLTVSLRLSPEDVAEADLLAALASKGHAVRVDISRAALLADAVRRGMAEIRKELDKPK